MERLHLRHEVSECDIDYWVNEHELNGQYLFLPYWSDGVLLNCLSSKNKNKNRNDVTFVN